MTSTSINADQLTAWALLPDHIDQLAAKLAGDTAVLRAAARAEFTAVPLGVWLVDKQAYVIPEPVTGDVDFDVVAADVDNLADRIKFAGYAVTVIDHLSLDRDGSALPVKVAMSPTLRRVGEIGNFFNGNYQGGIPNHPGPVSSMLTSGLLGAGLGYGAGWLGEQLMPGRWEKNRLRNTLAAVGGAVGAAPGAIYGAVNKMNGKPFNSNSLFAGTPGESPQLEVDPGYKQAVQSLCSIKLADDFESIADDYDRPRRRTPIDVNIDAMGHTLWQVTDPATAGTTVAALRTASRLPGGDRPGHVTPAQMGQLALQMGGGYISGALVGGALGLLAGMPKETQQTLADVGMYGSLVKSLIPHMFSTGSESDNDG